MRKSWIVLILIALIVIGGYFFLNRGPKFTVDIRSMQGLPYMVTDNMVQIEGRYDATYVPKKLQSQRKLAFHVDGNTLFTKEVITMPPKPKLGPNASSSGYFAIKDLPTTTRPGSYEDLKKEVETAEQKADLNVGSIYVEATFPENIYNIKGPLATQVYYKVFVDSPLDNE